jgi:putative aldouronate transport system permease protein
MKRDGIWFDRINYIILTVIAIIMLYPFVNVIAISFSSYTSYIQHPFMIFPTEFSLEGFKYVFKNGLVLSSYKNTIVITIVSTSLSLIFITLTAYPLSKKHLRGRKIFMNLLIFTMLFNGGLIPNFNLIKSLGWIDKLWALIIPGVLGAYNVILMKSFFENLPESLEEAAKIDGASDVTVFTKIVLPLSTPIIATIALFVAVGHWNSFFNAVIYIRSPKNWTLQLVLREILMSANNQLLASGGDSANVNQVPVETLRYATLVVAVIPIMCVYPFLQKYFVKGVTLGAVKG